MRRVSRPAVLGPKRQASAGGGGGGSYRHVRFRSLSSFPGDPTDVASVAEFNVLDAGGSAYSRAGWTATATSEFGGGGFEASRAIDGNTGTIWHSIGGGGLPQHLQIDMGTSQAVGGIRQLPRQDSPNGRYNAWELYGSNDASSWTLIGSGNFASGASEQTVYPL
jgi:hypothetical protein